MPPLSKKTDTPEVPPSEEWISVKHSKLDRPEGEPFRRVTRESFDEVWSDLGWVEIKGTGSNDPAPVEVADAAAANTGGN